MPRCFLSVSSINTRLFDDVRIFSLVPIDGGDFVRHLVEALLITHAECRLNTAGYLASQAILDAAGGPLPNPLAHDLWLPKLVRPSHPSSA